MSTPLGIAASLDTNILVRYIVKDDDRQSMVVAKVFEHHIRKSESLWVPVTVMLELEWVLRSRYKFSKTDVIRTMSGLLNTFELEFESEGAIEQALSSYEDGIADFAECLHLALARKGNALPFLTLDEKASKASGARLPEILIFLRP
ncbi:MAG: type II toxin-antitoxin system VapC family toxin [Limnohabitans sp.]|uniref:type II toxin-antitoxin system VapC family toxin n=1 Tax=Limnohabitans sp. TaxID=1907725 RepID=UPI0026000487|nr:type II toxin-antitoxin system VapC family toxin [Limnohabitans sp.]MCO4089993.1 type II toxin-antitoxin system VapC family toxin [Limnohabitans sp.]